MKFFTVKQLLFIIVVLSAFLNRSWDLPRHWQDHNRCLVLRPGMALVSLGSIAMLALC